MQGYGAVSISLSVLHTAAIYLFCFWLWQDFKKVQPSVSVLCAKLSLISFIISSLGPFALGALIANGLGHSKWYSFAVYYYLHFQYNGVFIFGVLSLFFKLLEDKRVQLNFLPAQKASWLLFISLFPGYFLSTLWAEPGLPFNIIGFIGAIFQLLALFYFIKSMNRNDLENLSPAARSLMMLAFSAFCIKSFLQLISPHPIIARLSFNVRPFTIAYLHLVLLGVVTFFLVAWYYEKEFIRLKSRFVFNMMLFGFIGTELMMVASGISHFDFFPFIYEAEVLLFFSICLMLAFIAFLRNAYRSL
jgi:hypothetical protein